MSAVRAGESQRTVAQRFRVPLSTVQYWIQRTQGVRLDRVDWSDQPRGAHPSARRTPHAIEDLILELRRDLRDHSDLGEFGAMAIHAAWPAHSELVVPSVRTIHRILERRGALDGKHRVRHRPPPRGWYLPRVAEGQAELDQFDLIEDLKIQSGPLVDVLTGISLHGGLVAAWPEVEMRAKTARNRLVEHWRAWGLPAYAQFDNDTLFQGPHNHPDAVGSVMRLCLSLGVTPVFAPPRESGFQAAIESFNGRWTAKVWSRFHHASLHQLHERCARYVQAHRARSAVRREGAPERRPFPPDWQLNLQVPLQGQIIFVRRTTDAGTVFLLGRTFAVHDHWVHRLVRCEVDLDRHVIRFYALRRRAPSEQPLLNTVAYQVPHRRFRE